MLSSNLEKTLRNAYQLATNSKHEFVTLEHLLKSLTDDKDALSVLKACGVEIEELKTGQGMLNDKIFAHITFDIDTGKFKKAEGPEKKHNVEPIYFHIVLNDGKTFNCDVPSGHNSFIYLLKGELKIGEKNHNKTGDSNLILFERGSELKIKAEKNTEFLFIAGKPIGEPIARGGPFVMNTKAEILEAIQDYNNGTFAKY